MQFISLSLVKTLGITKWVLFVGLSSHLLPLRVSVGSAGICVWNIHPFISSDYATMWYIVISHIVGIMVEKALHCSNVHVTA